MGKPKFQPSRQGRPSNLVSGGTRAAEERPPQSDSSSAANSETAETAAPTDNHEV
ncbi:MAG: hypothetical protein F6J97_07955 [Leptolyngbya sp. SIO4C1]|nr:hypothetical protein [Leptolyngbya sp. SIO4C1]